MAQTEPIDIVAELERDAASRDRLMANAPVIGSVALFGFVVLKVLLIARGDPSTALAIIGRAGVVQVAAGVLVLGIPFIATGIANVTGYMASSDEPSRTERHRLWYIFGFLVFALSFVLPWDTTLIILGYAMFPLVRAMRRRRREASTASTPPHSTSDWLASQPDDAVLRRLWHEFKELEFAPPPTAGTGVDLAKVASRRARQGEIVREWNDRLEETRRKARRPLDAIAVSLAIATLGPLVTTAINDRPWLPVEKVSAGTRAYVGYVVDVSPEWTTILVEDSRRVVDLPTKQIDARQICRLKNTAVAPTDIYAAIGSLFGAHANVPHYPRC